MSGIIVIFVHNNKTLLSHMDQISKHINSLKKSYDQIIKTTVKLGINKC